MAFSSDVSKWVKKAKERGTAALRGIAMEAVSAVQEKTPVRTGYLRSNWSAVKEGDAVPVPGRPSMAAVTDAQLGDRILVINPVEYARSVEFGRVGEDGKLHPGRGMVQQTLNEIPKIANRVVKEITG